MNEDAPRTTPTGSRAPGLALPVPSDRLTRNLHLLVLGILLAETVYWLAQPCTGDFMCAPVLGVFIAIPSVVLFVAVVIWRATGRVSPLVALDIFLLSGVGPELIGVLVSGGTGEPGAIGLEVAPFLLVIGAYGALADLAEHATERLLTVVVLVAEGSWFLVNNAAPLAFGPAIAVLLLLSGLVRRAPDSPPAEAVSTP